MKKLFLVLLLFPASTAFADIGNRDYGDTLFMGMWAYFTFIFSCITGFSILLLIAGAWRFRMHKVLLFIYALLPLAVYSIFFGFAHYYQEQYTRAGTPAINKQEALYIHVTIAAGFVLNALFMIWQLSKPKPRDH